MSFAGEFLLPPLNISYKQAQDPRRLNPELALGTRLQIYGFKVAYCHPQTLCGPQITIKT